MALLEQKDCLRLRDLYDSLTDGTYTYEKGGDIVEFFLKYDKRLVRKIESINGSSSSLKLS